MQNKQTNKQTKKNIKEPEKKKKKLASNHPNQRLFFGTLVHHS